MMAKDSVQKRLNGEARDGLSFTELPTSCYKVTTSCISIRSMVSSYSWVVTINGVT